MNGKQTVDASTKRVHVVDSNAVAPIPFEWGTLTWLFNREVDPEAQQTFGICRIQPGHSNPRHRHPNCDEILYVVRGECDHSLGEQTFRLRPGMMIRVPAGVAHHAQCLGSEPLEAIVVFSSGDRQTEGE